MKEHHKEHEHRKHRETGGVNYAEEDLKDHPEARTNAKKIDDEAEERKRGGRAKEHRAHGGKIHGEEKHHKDCKCKKCMGGKVERKSGGRTGFGPEDESTREKRRRGGHVMEHKKHVGEVHGEHAKERADRKPRKSGGRAAEDNPFSAARHGTPAKGRKLEEEFH